MFEFLKEKPTLFWVLAFLSLTPILLWPFVFFMSIFVFDDPNANIWLQYLIFGAMNSYPLVIILDVWFANRIWKKSKIISYLLLLWPFIGALWFVLEIFS